MLAILFFLIVIAFFGKVAVSHPHRVLALVLFMFAFEQLLTAHSPLFTQYGYLVNVVVGLMIGFAFFNLVITKKQNPVFPVTYWLTLGLFVYAFSNLFWLTGYAGTWHGKIWLDHFPNIAAILLCASLLIRSNESLRDVLLLSLAFGTIVCLGLQFTTSWDMRGVEQASNTEDARSAILTLAQAGGYVAVIAAFIHIPQIRGWAILRWIVVGLGLYLAFRTESRGQVVGAIAVIILYAPISWGVITGKSIAYGSTAILAIALCLYFITPWVNLERFQGTYVDRGLDARVGMVKGVVKEYMDSTPVDKVLGLGSSASYPISGFYIHNIPIEVLCEQGFIGFILLFLILGIPSWKVMRLLLKASVPEKRVVAPVREIYALDRNSLVIILALFTYEFLLMNKQGSLFSAMNLFLFAILIDRAADELKRKESIVPKKRKRSRSRAKAAAIVHVGDDSQGETDQADSHELEATGGDKQTVPSVQANPASTSS